MKDVSVRAAKVWIRAGDQARPMDRLHMWLVSRRVNNASTGDDDPMLVDEVAAWYSDEISAPGRAQPHLLE